MSSLAQVMGTRAPAFYLEIYASASTYGSYCDTYRYSVLSSASSSDSAVVIIVSFIRGVPLATGRVPFE
jgi:hypothetical protein